jgi:hypothetical protein
MERWFMKSSALANLTLISKRSCHSSACRVMLGALAQCMEHSVLSGACTYWARRHLDGDRKVQTKIAARLLANAKDGDDQSCLLVEFAKQVIARHSSNS